jgi:ATP-dependent DNA helicase DinG
MEEDPKLQVLPLRLGRPMATYLHRKGAVPLYMSATLAVRSSFQGIINELGIDMRVLQTTTAEAPEEAVEEWLKSQQLEAVVPGSATYAKISSNNPVNSFISSSPFDYERQAVVYVPRDLPDPSTYGKRGAATHPDYIRQLVAASRPLLDANEGHAFVLFTSNADLSAFDAELRRSGYHYPILSQAADPRLKSRGRDLFNSTPHATLLGTRTFFEGIDIPGLGLSLVIIPKLPFASPTPVMEAKKREYEGFEGFMNVDIPIMLTDLRQMAGRLIRSTGDNGVLAILDPRVHTKKGYGKLTLDELGMPNLRDREAPVLDYLRRVTLKRKGLPTR